MDENNWPMQQKKGSQKGPTPSEFFRKYNAERFSDTKSTVEFELPREVLAHELSAITTDLKTEQFETLCRRISEKLIAPNLIPQVGPMGGGDGKTDYETYPVSESISDRWFVTENGWDKDQKWAFAISAQKTWKSKISKDVKSIIETNRGYTRIYFLTNQRPSSLEKKQKQDDLIKQYQIDVVILDGEWLLENIYNNDLLEITVDALNLSETFKKKSKRLGQNDAGRLKRLEEIEEAIANPKRYFEFDHQRVEDALEAAKLARGLERPRDEVEGKFDRAVRFSNKLKSRLQLFRIHYERARTAIMWYDDYAQFIEHYNSCKALLCSETPISEIESLTDLINWLEIIQELKLASLSEFAIVVDEEINFIKKVLREIERDDTRPTAQLTASTLKCLIEIRSSLFRQTNVDKYLHELAININGAENLLDYPFERYKQLIEYYGQAFPDNIEFDNLIDSIALVSEKRNSELASGKIFLKRGTQKLKAKSIRDAIVFFGKSIRKLAKKETQVDLYSALCGLAQAYHQFGLLYASNNCYITALDISLKSWHQQGTVDDRSYHCAKKLAENELLLCRLPLFLNWNELLFILESQLNIEEAEVPFDQFRDVCLAVGILNSPPRNEENFQLLPDLLLAQGLPTSWTACQYRLGNMEELREDFKKAGILTEEKIDEYFGHIARQPFRNQMTDHFNFMGGERVTITTSILGCRFNVDLPKDHQLLLVAEMVLTYLEAFFATSLEGVHPHTETINLYANRGTDKTFLTLLPRTTSTQYDLNVNLAFSTNQHDPLSGQMIEVVSKIISRNFFVDNFEGRMKSLFENEEIMERLSLIHEHVKFMNNVLSDNPKLFYEDWLNNNYRKHERKRTGDFTMTQSPTDNVTGDESFPSKPVRHGSRTIATIFDNNLWRNARWLAFGFVVWPGNIMGIFLGFDNIDAGLKIFDEWISNFGKQDSNEDIRISIIKGISKSNPFWYRVHICKDIHPLKFKENTEIISISNSHVMMATNATNLTNLINSYNQFGEYVLFPVKFDVVTKQPQFFREKGIAKKKLYIREAWEVGEHDVDAPAIRPEDDPVIPDNVTNAPVSALKKHKSKNP